MANGISSNVGIFNPSNNLPDVTLQSSPQTNSTATPGVMQASVGYNGDIGWTVPSSQLVKVVSSLDASNGDGINVITGILDKPFSMSTSSEWKAFISPLPDSVNDIAQFLTGGKASASSIYSSRRIWVSSEPLTLSLSLQFYAVNDAFSEVVSPCIRLQRLALPSYQSGNLAFLTPPGPSPYSWASSGQVNSSDSIGGDNIEIYVGYLIYFEKAIVKRVTVEFDNKYDQNGYPLKGTATVEFQTYQVTTKSDISKMVNPNLSQPQPQVSQTPTPANSPMVNAVTNGLPTITVGTNGGFSFLPT